MRPLFTSQTRDFHLHAIFEQVYFLDFTFSTLIKIPSQDLQHKERNYWQEDIDETLVGVE